MRPEVSNIYAPRNISLQVLACAIRARNSCNATVVLFRLQDNRLALLRLSELSVLILDLASHIP